MDRLALRGSIEAYRTTDAVEAGHRATLLALLDAPGDPFDRERFDPGHITASAVVVSPDATAMLMVFHRGLGRWLQPGGHVEPGDTDIRSAALREVLEETGQREFAPWPNTPALLDLDVHAIPARGRLPRHLHHDVRVLVRAREGALQPGSDVRVAEWVPLVEVPRRNPEASIARILARLRTLPELA